ncbi:aldo/keto reductase [Devriesea agamarum]|uniref:aldo/keto reductase n=1 Tax=Devriesea agamarum TaxID=472569 RepID=UPI00071E2AF0|nr:aldo/keto reductase [Devriesea agamarum]
MTDATYKPAIDRYTNTDYRRCGRSGLFLSPVSLGLWHNFGHDRHYDVQRSIVRKAFDLGVTSIDIANNYGPPPGAAEEIFGRILRDDLHPYRDELVISTKAGYRMWSGPYGDYGSRKYLLASLDQSLRRLGVDYVDIFYHHRMDPQTPLEESLGALATAVQQGKALYVGLSNYSPEKTRQAAQILHDMGVPLLICQPSYSMFNRTIEHGLLSTLNDLGVGAAVFSPLQQGLLTSRYLGGVPEGSRAASNGFLTARQVKDRAYLHRAHSLQEVAAERGQSLAQMALAWVLRHREVTTAIVGASSAAQLSENVRSLSNTSFTAEELRIIDTYAVHGTAA